MTADANRVLRVGLTGGVASGKSTVAALLAERGAAVLDADLVVERLYSPGGAGSAVVRELFGPTAVAPDGAVDRRALGVRVLADVGDRRRLEAAIHPLVRAEVNRWLTGLAFPAGVPRVAVVEAALLVETGSWRDYDRLVVVAAPAEVRRSRALAAGWDGARFDRIVAAQASDEQREAPADYLVRNDGDPLALERAAAALWESLVEDTAAAARGIALPVRRRSA